ncbi:MAG: acetyl-CoA carboxylase biotin carboxyl carrier protein subunit, partial [Actinobacteria bacterium]|nr:acetyl-CoA carboxylase biotin carboxyl carrier protein subunit [Actinomycetota bacterium]
GAVDNLPRLDMHLCDDGRERRDNRIGRTVRSGGGRRPVLGTRKPGERMALASHIDHTVDAEVHVEPGQVVDGANPIVVIEAMKMLHTLTTGGPGIVDEVRVAPGDHVESSQILITFENPEETEDA